MEGRRRPKNVTRKTSLRSRVGALAAAAMPTNAKLKKPIASSNSIEEGSAILEKWKSNYHSSRNARPTGSGLTAVRSSVKSSPTDSVRPIKSNGSGPMTDKSHRSNATAPPLLAPTPAKGTARNRKIPSRNPSMLSNSDEDEEEENIDVNKVGEYDVTPNSHLELQATRGRTMAVDKLATIFNHVGTRNRFSEDTNDDDDDDFKDEITDQTIKDNLRRREKMGTARSMMSENDDEPQSNGIDITNLFEGISGNLNRKFVPDAGQNHDYEPDFNRVMQGKKMLKSRMQQPQYDAEDGFAGEEDDNDDSTEAEVGYRSDIPEATLNKELRNLGEGTTNAKFLAANGQKSNTAAGNKQKQASAKDAGKKSASQRAPVRAKPNSRERIESEEEDIDL